MFCPTAESRICSTKEQGWGFTRSKIEIPEKQGVHSPPDFAVINNYTSGFHFCLPKVIFFLFCYYFIIVFTTRSMTYSIYTENGCMCTLSCTMRKLPQKCCKSLYWQLPLSNFWRTKLLMLHHFGSLSLSVWVVTWKVLRSSFNQFNILWDVQREISLWKQIEVRYKKEITSLVNFNE